MIDSSGSASSRLVFWIRSAEITSLEAAPAAEEYRRQNRKYNQLVEEERELPDSGQVREVQHSECNLAAVLNRRLQRNIMCEAISPPRHQE